jgi:hypothetical protein
VTPFEISRRAGDVSLTGPLRFKPQNARAMA